MQRWVIGVLLTIFSAAGSTAGLILQKLAHVQESDSSTNGSVQETKSDSESAGVSKNEPNNYNMPTNSIGDTL